MSTQNRSYHLHDPREPNRPRYGGASKSRLAERLASHVVQATRATDRTGLMPVRRAAAWIRDLLAAGVRPQIVATDHATEQEAIDAIPEEDRLNERRAGGGRKGFMLSPAERTLLGHVPDRVAAEAIGCKFRSVERWRSRDGVGPFKQGPPTKADRPLIEARMAEFHAARAAELADAPPPIRRVLGTAPDREIAGRYGLEKSYVAALRRKAGVPSWRSTNPAAGTGGEATGGEATDGEGQA